MTTNVSEDLRLQPKLADSLAMGARLLRRRRRSKLDVLDTKGIECVGDGDFGLGVEEGVGKLFALWTESEWCDYKFTVKTDLAACSR